MSCQVIRLVCIATFWMVAASLSNAQQSKVSPLVQLARDHFGGLSTNDEQLLAAVADGTAADYRTGAAAEDDMTNSAAWTNRIIDASELVWLCTDKKASSLVTFRGLQIDGARIDGELDLGDATIKFPLNFNNCVFSDTISLNGSRVHSLELNGCHIGYLDADEIKADESITLDDGFQASGNVDLINATIYGNLNCTGGTFLSALTADSAKIGGNVFFCDGFSAQGDVSVQGTAIGGDLDCEKGQFTSALNGGKAVIKGNVEMSNGFLVDGELALGNIKIGGCLDMEDGTNLSKVTLFNAQIGSDAFLRNGFTAAGNVDLDAASIGSDLYCNGGFFLDTNSGETALYLDNTRITGDLYLNGGLKMEGTLDLRGVTVGGSINCDGETNITDILADSAKINGDVLMGNGFIANGDFEFKGATIGGDLDCSAGQFAHRGTNLYVMEGANSKVGGDIILGGGFRADGTVSLKNSSVAGNLDCSGGSFFQEATDTPALDVEGIKIAEDGLFSKGFTATGSVSLAYANISRNFVFRGVISPKDSAVHLESASVGALVDDANSWPSISHLFLDNFNYTTIQSCTNVEMRLAWLRSQSTNLFLPQPYDQLAGVFRKMGLEDDAVKVIIAKNLDFARHLKWYAPARLWYNGLGWLIGYGCRTWFALIPSFFFIIFGAVLFKVAYQKLLILPSEVEAYSINEKDVFVLAEKYKYYPKFNALVFSFEVFVPLIKLGLDDFWRPAATRGAEINIFNHKIPISGAFIRLYWWVHIIAGWILTTLWFAGLTGLAKS